MLKALYDFGATFAKTLSFQENDHFVLYQNHTKQRNWWQVVNSRGQVGYIPSNYVSTIKVHPQFIINFLDEAIEALRSSSDKPSVSPNIDKQDLLLRLVEKKRQAELGRKTKKQAPLPPDFGSITPVKEPPINFNNIEQDQTSPTTHTNIKDSLNEYCKGSQLENKVIILHFHQASSFYIDLYNHFFFSSSKILSIELQKLVR